MQTSTHYDIVIIGSRLVGQKASLQGAKKQHPARQSLYARNKRLTSPGAVVSPAVHTMVQQSENILCAAYCFLLLLLYIPRGKDLSPRLSHALFEIDMGNVFAV